MSADGLERRIVVEITPTIDSAGTTQTFLFGEKGFPTAPTDTPAEVVVRGLLLSAGQWQQDLFGGSRLGGSVVPGGGVISLVNEGGVLDPWVDYGIDGAKVVMRWGQPGAAYPSGYSTVLIAYGLTLSAGFRTMEITLRDRLYLLDKPMSAGTFGGTGGLDGTGVAGQRMQWVAGDPGFIPPILLDATRQLYFVQDAATGGIQDYRFGVPTDETITAPFDVYVGGVRVTRGANYASTAECLSTAPAAGEVRFWFGDPGGFGANLLGPVYMRLGTVPTYKVRVYAEGYAPDGAGWFLNDVVARAGLNVSTYYGTGESVRSRLVSDDATYLSVMDDSCIADLSAYGFTRLDEFFSVRIQEPAAADTTVFKFTDTGTEQVTRTLFTFNIANSKGWMRSPVPGMPAPFHRVTMTSGEAWPHELDPACSARMREALQRDTAWASFTGENPSILTAHPGARAIELTTKERYFQNRFGESLWVMQYLTLFGGLRWILTLEADMTDVTLGIELMDNVVVDIPRFQCAGGRPFRVVSKKLNIDARTIEFGLWGGSAGPGGYLVTTTGGAPTVVNPMKDLGRLGDIGLLAYSHADSPSWAFPGIGEIQCSATSHVIGQCKLLLNFEFADGTTSIVDESEFARTLTGNTYCAVSTTRAKFGSASLKLLNTTQLGLSIAAHADFGYSTGQKWTIHYWIYIDTWPSAVTFTLIDFYYTPSSLVMNNGISGAAATIKTQTNAGGGSHNGTTNISTGAWHHVAIEDDGTNTITYLDGTVQYTDAIRSASGSNAICVGGYHAYSAATSSDGTVTYIDAYQLVIGKNLFGGAFTPPTTAPTTSV